MLDLKTINKFAIEIIKNMFSDQSTIKLFDNENRN